MPNVKHKVAHVDKVVLKCEKFPVIYLKALLLFLEKDNKRDWASKVWFEQGSAGITLSTWGRNAACIVRLSSSGAGPIGNGAPLVRSIDANKFSRVARSLKSQHADVCIMNDGTLTIGKSSLTLARGLGIPKLSERIEMPEFCPQSSVPNVDALDKIVALAKLGKLEPFYSISLRVNMVVVSFRKHDTGEKADGLVVLARPANTQHGLIPYPFAPEWALVCEDGTLRAATDDHKTESKMLRELAKQKSKGAKKSNAKRKN
jgi:hypothetical protein